MTGGKQLIGRHAFRRDFGVRILTVCTVVLTLTIFNQQMAIAQSDEKPKSGFGSFLKRAISGKSASKAKEPRIQQMVRKMVTDARRLDQSGDVAGAIQLVRRADKMVSVASKTTPIEWTQKEEAPAAYLKQLETKWRKLQADRLRKSRASQAADRAVPRMVGITIKPDIPPNQPKPSKSKTAASAPKVQTSQASPKASKPTFAPVPAERIKLDAPTLKLATESDKIDWSPEPPKFVDPEAPEFDDEEEVPFGQLVEDVTSDTGEILPAQFETEEASSAEETTPAPPVESVINTVSRTESAHHNVAAPKVETLGMIEATDKYEEDNSPSILKLDEPAKAAPAAAPVTSVVKPTIVVNSPPTPWLKTALVQFLSTILAICLVLIAFLLVRQMVYQIYGTKLGLVLQVQRPGDESDENTLAYAPADTVKFPLDERLSEPTRRGVAHDINDLPIPLRVVSTYEDERQSELAKQKEQEQAMMKHIFQQNKDLQLKIAELD